MLVFDFSDSRRTVSKATARLIAVEVLKILMSMDKGCSPPFLDWLSERRTYAATRSVAALSFLASSICPATHSSSRRLSGLSALLATQATACAIR